MSDDCESVEFVQPKMFVFGPQTQESLSESQLEDAAWEAVLASTQCKVKIVGPSDASLEINSPQEEQPKLVAYSMSTTNNSTTTGLHNSPDMSTMEAAGPPLECSEELFSIISSSSSSIDDNNQVFLPISPPLSRRMIRSQITLPSFSSPEDFDNVEAEIKNTTYDIIAIPEAEPANENITTVPETQDNNENITTVPETQDNSEVLLHENQQPSSQGSSASQDFHIGGMSRIYPTEKQGDITEAVILVEPWSELNMHLFQHNRKVVNAIGDGFCFLNSIEECMCIDHRLALSVKTMCHLITGELIDNSEFYKRFHPVQTADELVADAVHFFESKHFRLQVVDVVVQAASKALNLDIFIYMENLGRIEVRKQCGRNENALPVYLLFSQVQQQDKNAQNQEPLSHYDSVVTFGSKAPLHIVILEDPEPDVEDIDAVQTSSQPEAAATPVSTSAPQKSTDASSNISFDECTNDEIAICQSSLKARRIPFPDGVFHNMEPEWVDEVPSDINGTKLYHILTTPASVLKVQQDLRHFHMKASKRKNFTGIRKVGWCSGSLICTNEECPFAKSTTKRNISHWKGGIGSKCCFSCGYEGVERSCPARKMTEYCYKTNVLKVCHLHNHTCSTKMDKTRYDKELEKVADHFPHMPGISAIREEMMHYAQNGDFEKVQQIAKETSNTRRFLQLQRKVKERNITGRQSIESIATVKEGSDKVDKFLCWRINGDGMNENPGYVFKTAAHALDLCLEMDCSKDGALNDQECFFDGMFSRCKDWITLACWVYHPASRRLMKIATMEVRSERTQHIALFWNLLNEALREHTGVADYIFNPVAFMVDEAGANHCGIQEAFGEEVATTKVITCQSHFFHNMHKRAIYLKADEEKAAFKRKCIQLTQVTGKQAYKNLMKDLFMIAEADDRVRTFLEWWHVRKYHIFGPFRGIYMKRSNWSEIGNAMLKRKLGKLWLVQAAQDDICQHIGQGEQHSAFLSSQAPSTGKGPDQRTMDNRIREAQMTQAKDFAATLQDKDALREEIHGSDDEVFYPSPLSTHKAPEKAGIQGYIRGKRQARGRGCSRGRGAKRRRYNKSPVTVAEMMRQAQLLRDNAAQLEKQVQQHLGDANTQHNIAPAHQQVIPNSQQSAVQQQDQHLGDDNTQHNIPPVHEQGIPSSQQPAENITQSQQSSQGNLPMYGGRVRPVTDRPNPPVAIEMVGFIRKCCGCNSDFKKEEMLAAPDLIFKMLANRPYERIRGSGIWQDKEAYAYFHLDMNCLRRHNPVLRLRDCIIYENQWGRLNHAQEQQLENVGLLEIFRETMG